jgi:hypothetical protein
MKDGIHGLIKYGRKQLKGLRRAYKKAKRSKNWRKLHAIGKKAYAVKKDVDTCMQHSKCWKKHFGAHKEGRQCLKSGYCMAVTHHMFGDAWIRHALQMCFWSKKTCVLTPTYM